MGASGVVIADLERERANADPDHTFIACDVSSSADVRRLFDTTVARFGRIDVLFNNAGIPGSGKLLHETDDAVFDRVVAVNLGGVFRCAKYALPHMMASGGGAIVNVSSAFGMVAAPRSAAYGAAKGGIIQLTRAMATEYGEHAIRVNALCPGYVDNDMARRRTRMSPEAAAEVARKRESAAARQPLGRQASVEEIAHAAIFLASAQSSFLTGAIVPVDGGLTATFNSGA